MKNSIFIILFFGSLSVVSHYRLIKMERLNSCSDAVQALIEVVPPKTDISFIFKMYDKCVKGFK